MAGKALKYVREQRPAHHIFKIESFSKLCKVLKGTKTDYFESREFTAGGYKWILSIYPDGKKDGDLDAGGHISLYLTLVNKLPPFEFFHATIRFFIYNQLEENYSTIQDIKGKRFDPTRDQWGVPQFIEATIFHNPVNGFLVNDCCLFGVEVLVSTEKERTVSCLSMVEDLLENNKKFAWRIEKFSKLKDPLYSKTFDIGGYKWKLRLYPRGVTEFKERSLSLYLQPVFPCEKKLFVEFELCLKVCLKGEVFGNYQKKTDSRWFSKDSYSWGFKNFVSLTDFSNPDNGYKPNDPIIIQVKFLQMMALRDM